MVGFFGYRYHWAQDKKLNSDKINKIINTENFTNYILKVPSKEWENYDVILGEKIFVADWKLSKIFKKIFIKNF